MLPALQDRAVDVTGDIYSGHVEAVAGPADVPTPSVMLAAMGPRMLRARGRPHRRHDPVAERPAPIETQIRPALDAAAVEAGRPAPRIVASVPVCVTDDPDAVKGLIADRPRRLQRPALVSRRHGPGGRVGAGRRLARGRRGDRARRARAIRRGGDDRLLRARDPDQSRRGGAHPRRSSRTCSPDAPATAAQRSMRRCEVRGRGAVAGTVAVEQARERRVAVRRGRHCRRT